MVHVIAYAFVGSMILPFSSSLQMTSFEPEDRTKPQKDEESTSQDEEIEMLPSDNLSVWGSAYKPNGKYPRLAIGLSCPKCGSSFFYQVLARHPSIVGGAKKETEYFSGNDAEGNPLSVCPAPEMKTGCAKTDFLNSCFLANSRGEAQDPWNTNKTLFEFTPGYLTQAADDADIMLQFEQLDSESDSRFIVVLRDPVERYVSELNMMRLNRDFMKAMSDSEIDKLALDKVSTEEYSIRLGHYAENLKMWLKTFPKERLLVINKVALDNRVTWRRVLKFLGLTHENKKGEEIIPSLIANAKEHEDQVSSPKDGYLKLSDMATTKLKEHYQAHDEKLWRLLDVEPWWTQ